MPIEQLELSQRTYNCLKRSQITRVGQILEKAPDELLQLRNFGQKSLLELQDKLRQHGLSLSGTEPESDLQAGIGDMEGDEVPEELLAGDLLGESEPAEEDDEMNFEAALASDEFEDEAEEPFSPRAARGRGARGARAGDDWEDR